MAVATFPLAVWSVLAAELIADFEISRAMLGILATATGLVGALVSPVFGRFTDRLGSLRSVRSALVVGALALVGIALSPTYWILVVAALLAGVPNGWGNPATNALIVDTVPPGSRGLVTGVKQSGVQVGSFLGGLLLPTLAGLWDWRGAVLAFVLIPTLGLAGTVGHHSGDANLLRGSTVEGQVPKAIYWIAFYGAVSGLATSAVFVFLPLFAEEDRLWSPQAAGLLIAVVGLTGFVSRIIWPTVSERFVGHGRALRAQGVVSAFSAVLLTLAAMEILGSWVLVPAAFLLAAGSIAWNAVGMLAVMDLSPKELVGKGTGIVLLGFLLGYGVGSPLMGLSVDAFDSYVPGWIGVVFLLLASAVIAGRVPSHSTLARS
jgi:MFS family permease